MRLGFWGVLPAVSAGHMADRSFFCSARRLLAFSSQLTPAISRVNVRTRMRFEGVLGALLAGRIMLGSRGRLLGISCVLVELVLLVHSGAQRPIRGAVSSCSALMCGGKAEDVAVVALGAIQVVRRLVLSMGGALCPAGCSFSVSII